MQAAKKALIVGALVMCPLFVWADDTTHGERAHEDIQKAPQEEPDKFTITGYVDASYSYLSRSNQFTNDTFSRVFDRARNGGRLNNIDLTAAFLPKQGFGGMLNVNFGDDPNVFGAADTNLTDRYDVQAAHVYFADGALTTIAGKYVTLAGAEVIKSPNDVNFSRSILFGYAIPFTHTGIRFGYALNDQVTLYGGINNGWDVVDDNNSEKTLEFAASIVPSDAWALFADVYSGKELGSTGVNGTRNFLDIVATFHASPQLDVVLNVDFANQNDALGAGQDADWSGVAGYLNYKVNDQWRVSLRGEYFDDEDGFRTGIVQKWKEATLTLAYMPSEAVELRGEVRRDWSNVNAFRDDDGSAADSQYSIGLEAIYKFSLL